MKRSPVALLWIATAVIVCAADTAPVPEVPVDSRPFPEWLGGAEPTRLSRVMPGETPDNLRHADEYIGRYEVLPGTVALPPAWIEKLAPVLANASAFGELRPDRCRFRPGVALRATTGDLLICFACDEIGVVPEDGKLVAVYSFDQATRDALLSLSKQLLPDDEAIQELPEVRRDTAPPPIPALPPGAN